MLLVLAQAAFVGVVVGTLSAVVLRVKLTAFGVLVDASLGAAGMLVYTVREIVFPRVADNYLGAPPWSGFLIAAALPVVRSLIRLLSSRLRHHTAATEPRNSAT